MKPFPKQQVLHTFSWFHAFGAAILLAATCCALSTSAAEQAAQDTAGNSAVAPLRVAIAPDYPPLVFRQPDGTNGLEIDLAKALGPELNRPIEFVVLERDELIPALMHNEADIIMSGMSITKGRQLRIAFSEPYLHNQIRAIFRQKDADRFKTPQDILLTTAKVGAIPGTTGDMFVSKNCKRAERVAMYVRRDVPTLLLRGERMDVFIDDTFALAPMVAQHEAEIAYIEQPLSEEDIAWGIRQNDQELLASVNKALAKWKADGTLQKTLDRWIPYLKKLSSQPKT